MARGARTDGRLGASGHETADALAGVAHAAVARARSLRKHVHPVAGCQPLLGRLHARLLQPRAALHWQDLPTGIQPLVAGACMSTSGGTVPHREVHAVCCIEF
jgi:hypothetical protein